MRATACRAAARFASRAATGPSWRPVARLSTSSAPLRLEPQLEGIINRFQSSLRQSRATKEEKTKTLVDDFGQLQRVRVQNVLLVCTDYDSYTFEEEGLLNELVYQVCARANLALCPSALLASAPSRHGVPVSTLTRRGRASRSGTPTTRSPSLPSSTASRRPSSASRASRSATTTWWWPSRGWR